MDKNKQIIKYSSPTQVTKKAKRYAGKNVRIALSTKKGKKYMIQTPNKKWVHFGAMGYEDFTKHKNKTRRKRYLDRATHIKGYWKRDKYSPNNLAIHLLW